MPHGSSYLEGGKRGKTERKKEMKTKKKKEGGKRGKKERKKERKKEKY